MKKKGKVNSNRILFQLSDSSSFIPGKLKFSPLARHRRMPTGVKVENHNDPDFYLGGLGGGGGVGNCISTDGGLGGGGADTCISTDGGPGAAG
ncbi:MAG: hypothetical protein D4R97_09565 [Bacteroidetes bacterium]|nr:MAG: hypothetical protein D4R97_09565 [Bacteroidota bacterium]